MNELITTSQNESGEITLSGRELHQFLEVGTQYTKWVERMLEYGFVEGVDFIVVYEKVDSQKRLRTYEQNDHQMKLDMAKEIAMIQRTDKGKEARQYFLELERKWNSPEMVMKRAMDYLNDRVAKLQTTNLVLEQQVSELKPKATYYDMVLQNKSLLSVSKIAKDYGMSAMKFNKLLHDLGVQYKQGDIWLMYAKYQDKGYTQTSTYVTDADSSKISTKWTQIGRLFVYDLLRSEGILPIIEREVNAS